MYCSCFPSLTPFYYLDLLTVCHVNNVLQRTSFRMQPHYKKQFKKSK